MILEKGNNRNLSRLEAYEIHLYPRRGACVEGETMSTEVKLEDKGLAECVAVVKCMTGAMAKRSETRKDGKDG